MAQYDVLKGSTVVGHITIASASESEPEHVLRIGQLVGSNCCHRYGVDYDGIVDDYSVDWDRLDNDRVLDEQPWGLEPR